eukprot:jgi/Tetstr1/440044/TSEL_028403.t1
MPARECQFPHFRERFWASACWASVDEAGRTVLEEPGEGMEAAFTRPAARAHRQNLKSLDLRCLPREDAPPSELQLRREKFAYYEKRCSEVADGLFVGGEAVAKSIEILRQSGITHVVNCVGFIYPEYFKDELTYRTLRLQDTPSEDISSVLYDVFDFFQDARSVGGKVFVHCSQGVSRSATLVIAFLMWKLDQPYDDVFAAVKAIRGVANPNIGFTCQLLQWHKRRHMESFARVYRIAPHSHADPLYLVPKLLSGAGRGCLDPRGSSVVHTERALFVWWGARCPPAMRSAAERAAGHLMRYEGAPQALHVRHGEETAQFWEQLQDPEATADSVAEVDAFTRDFEIYLDAALKSNDPEHRSAIPSVATHQMRDQVGSPAPGSPNQRCKKYRRSNEDPSEAGEGIPFGLSGLKPLNTGVSSPAACNSPAAGVAPATHTPRSSSLPHALTSPRGL